MSVIIKDMDMPSKCEGCPCYYPEYHECNATTGRRVEGKGTPPKDCPIVHFPTPHGRLIDADALHKEMYFLGSTDTMWQNGLWVRYKAVERLQKAAPTIIEAEE